MASKCDRVVAPIIMLLQQHHAKPLLRGIGLQQEGFVEVREHQQRHGLNLILQDSHYFMHLQQQLHRTHLDLLPQHMVERPCYMSKFCNEVPIMPFESTESTDLGVGLRHGKLLNHMYVVSAGADSLSRDVGQVHNL